MSKRDQRIETATFGTIIERTLELKTEEEIRTLEEYASNIDDINKLALGWSEDYTEVVNLEDELANAKGTFIHIEGHKVLLGGQPITFIKTGKTYTATLNGVHIKGNLKRKLVATLTHGTEPKITHIGTEAVAKYLVQYLTYALEIYVFKNGNSFFKVYMSSKAMRRKNTIQKPKTYSYEEEDKLDGNMFPEIELDMLERALELEEELTNLMFKSEAVTRAITARRKD